MEQDKNYITKKLKYNDNNIYNKKAKDIYAKYMSFKWKKCRWISNIKKDKSYLWNKKQSQQKQT